MLSFEQLNKQADLYAEQNEDPRESAFKSKSKDFWKNLAEISASGNIEGFSQILHISPAQLKSWRRLINDAIDEFENKEKEQQQYACKTGINNE